MTFQLFLQQLINGLGLGSLYGLIAIGYTMVYGILRLINFAHGDVMMMSTYFAFFGVSIFALPWWVAALLAMILTGLLGISIDQGAYRPLRRASRISALITAIGVSFFLENAALVVFGSRPRAFYRPEMFRAIWHFGDISLLSLTGYTILITLCLLVIVYFIVYKTRMGMAMRAVSKDMHTVPLMGIDLNRVVAFTFGLGSVIAAVGGILWAMKYPQIEPLMGIIPGLKAFVAAVLGG
ncbi:MAG TPA: branched-chain amino acid ABC transporter permease, partial [Desulfobulbaceae bacterium]|nr:branched-chain amino acid ABC transporter permease [Desulfobulbaceae bacterium]